MRTARALVAIVATLLSLGFGTAHAQSSSPAFPSRPVRMIVPFPPGGSTDVLARLLGQKLSESWGQQVVIDNRPGGNTLIGAELAAKSAADGYTLFMPIDFTLTMNQTLYSKLPYDPVRDFAPISLLTVQSILLTVNPKLPVKTVAELVAYAKANPGKLNYGTGATIAQLAGELLQTAAGIKLVHVPFKGSAPTLQALVAGDVEMTISDISPYLPYFKDGRLRGIATMGLKRAQSLPDLPTMQEAGYPGFEVRSWFGLVAPAATPAAIVNRINADVVKAMSAPDVRERLAGLGLESVPGTPAEFAAQIRAETEKWTPVIKAAGMKMD